jgi:hypothetical protein
VTSPPYLYAFGNEGGPYKVGFSSDPARRALNIVAYEPGSRHTTPDAAFLRLIRLPDRSTARAAEARAHAMLAAHRVGHRDAADRPIGTTEWFAADLSAVLTAMAQAVADIPDAEVCETVPPRVPVASPDTQNRIKTAQLTLRIDPALKEAAEQLAAEERRSVTSLFEKLLVDALRARGLPPPPPKPREPKA